jgi:DNA-binding CsgD family transcriptional regulator
LSIAGAPRHTQLVNKPDLLDVVDAAYAATGSPGSWLAGVMRAARPLLNRGEGLVGVDFDAANEATIHLGHPVFDGADRAVWRGMQAATEGLSVRAVRRTYLGTRPFGTVAQRFEGRARGTYWELSRRCYRPNGYADLLVLHVVDADRRGCIVAAPMSRSRPASRKETVLWSRVAGHVRAGHRLNLRLTSRAPGLLSAPEAILAADGRVLHAEGAAKTRAARNALRRAALAIDRARESRARSCPEFALGLWAELVAGRWTLLDRFDSDGRRYLIAHRNDPCLAEQASLTFRERDVIDLVLVGHSNKYIAGELEISESTVSEHLSIALQKLNLRSAGELSQVASLTRNRRERS